MMPSPVHRAVTAALCLFAATIATAATHVIQVQDNNFSPSELTLCLGDTVEWQWTGAMDHTVTSGDGCGQENGAWDSGLLGNGGTFSFTFTSIPAECATDSSAGADTCSYFCIPHCSMMDGVLTIVSGGGPSIGLGLSRNKLRISHNPTEGRGGTVVGVEMVSGAQWADVTDVSVTVVLNATGPGGPVMLSDSATLSGDGRGGFSASLPANGGEDLNIRSVSLKGTHEPDVAKLGLKYETNGVDLSQLSGVMLTVTIEHDMEAACGATVVTATATGPVSL